MVQTRKVAVQLETHQIADAEEQMDFPDIMEDLKKTSGKLTNIVAELMEFKAKQTLRPTLSTPPLYFSNSDTLSDSLISGTIDQEPVAAVDQSLFVPVPSVNPAIPTSDKLPPAMNQHLLVPTPPVTDSTVPAPDKLSPVNQCLLVPAPSVTDSAVPASGQNRFLSMSLSSTSPHPQLRSPLPAIDINAQVVFKNIDRWPTDDQKCKVEAIVLMSSHMVPSAMAAVNVLF